MAEFCLECWNKLHETNETEDEYIFSENFCEECCEYKMTIVANRNVRLARYLWPYYAVKKLFFLTLSLPRKISRKIKNNPRKK